MARVDCYLISAAEISIDVDAHLLDEYLDTQHLFLRRLLGINSRSMLAVLFTETGLMPIRIRCLLLALAPSLYGWALGDRRVRWALLDSVDLFAAGNACWAGDIAILLRALPTPIRVIPGDFLSIPTIDAITKKVVEAADADLQFDINFLQKTHLLRDRLELAGESKTLVAFITGCSNKKSSERPTAITLLRSESALRANADCVEIRSLGCLDSIFLFRSGL
jgi:hypothetical protein